MKKPIKIIFLDDSVLCTHRVQFSRLERGNPCEYDPVVVDFLDSLCSKYLCYIVITSKERKKLDERDWYRSKMTQSGGGMLTDFLFCDDVMWKVGYTMECKAFEIDDWFNEFNHTFGNRYTIENYVIIDKDDLGRVSMHDKKFVHIKNKFNGMGVDEFRRVVKILENEV